MSQLNQFTVEDPKNNVSEVNPAGETSRSKYGHWIEEVKASSLGRYWPKIVKTLAVEEQGNEPVPAERQTERRYLKLFTLWFSMNFNLLSVSTGMVGPLGFGLGLLDSTLVFIFFGFATAVAAPGLSLFGTKLGLRQMVLARYSFGLYGVAVPLCLNMATLAGYVILGSVLGGQALAAVNPGHISVNVGIAIIAIINLFITFCGSRVIHWFDLYAWAPMLVGIVVATGCSGHQLVHQAPAPEATREAVLGLGAVVAGFFLPWATIASDFTTYFDRDLKNSAILIPSYIGLTLSAIPLMVLGAAIGGALPNVESWSEGYSRYDVGGAVGAMLQPAGGFGKFLLVLLALSNIPNAAGSMYGLALNWQAFFNLFDLRIPRVIYPLAITAIIIPVAIRVAADFLPSLFNFVGIIGFWSSCFITVIALEHLVIRRGEMRAYNVAHWDTAKLLPTGISALGASFCSLGLVIPGTAKTWYTGPIAKHSGDIGFEMAIVVTGLLYVPFRIFEKKFRGH